MSKNKKIFVGIFLVVLTIAIFFLGRLSKPKEFIIQTPNEAKYLRIIDSVQKIFNAKQDSIIKYYQNIKTNEIKKVDNHKKLKDEINIVESTPINYYNHLLDSLYSAR